MKFFMKCGAFMKLYTKYEVSLLLTHITMHTMAICTAQNN